jgi:hypothetical protein
MNTRIFRKTTLPFLIALLFICPGCEYGTAIRAIYGKSEAEWETDGDFDLTTNDNGIITSIDTDFDEDLDISEHTRYGLELGGQFSENAEFIFQLGVADFDLDEVGGVEITGPRGKDVDPDGYFMGFGFQSPTPEAEGLGIDWRVRMGLHYYDWEEDSKGGDASVSPDYAFDEDADLSFYGFDGDARIGAHYGIPLGSELVVSPHGGLQIHAVKGYLDGEYKFVESSTMLNLYSSHKEELEADYDLFATGAYLGFDLNLVNDPSFNLAFDYYVGNNDVQGMLLSMGVMF